MEGLHTSAIHVVVKPGEDKIRVTVDSAASGLNSGTNMDEILLKLGEFNNPTVRSLARLLARAMQKDKKLLYKTDVSGAFSTMKLSAEAALA
jgi:hypothetical protein